MYQKVDYPERECAYCGDTFTPKTKSTRFCSKPCSRKSWVTNNPEAAAESRRKARIKVRRKEYKPKQRGPFVCRNCGVEYTTSRPNGEGETYCSRECSFADKKAAQVSRVRFKVCTVCNEWFRVKGRASICSDKCRRQQAAEKERARNIARHGTGNKVATVVCLVCRVEFSRLYGNSALTCSDSCGEEMYKAGQRKAKSARRARLRGNTVELFDPVEVLARDNWRCQHCGRNTPQKLRGTSKPNAPEVDHVIPISLGGEHSKRNTQCLCRECNQTKGAGTLCGGEQMRLLA